jgi:hypothetical protein
LNDLSDLTCLLSYSRLKPRAYYFLERQTLNRASNYALVYRCPMRLANSAGVAMARDSGTIRALMTMSPQIATE